MDSFRVLPPSFAALKEHVKRSAFIAGHLLGKADELNPLMPDYTDWGWSMDSGILKPVWTLKTSDTIYKELQKTCQCGEKNSCMKSNCSCKDTICLPYCKCRGQCNKDKKLNKLLCDDCGCCLYR